MRKLFQFTLVGTALSIPVLAHGASAQEGARPPGTVKPESEISAELDRSNPELGIVAGQITQLIESDEGRIVVRRRQAGPNNASVHEDLNEIYQIISGAGVFVTGGTITNPEERTAGITGGVARRVEAGDFVILPPGTPHWFREIEGSIIYVETRFNTGP
jgi:mannose-6-phosphate isomerase-like protein (cupin superfamily)